MIFFSQLWMVFHFCSRICLPVSSICPRLHSQANGEPMEDVREALCRPDGLPWTYQGLSGFP